MCGICNIVNCVRRNLCCGSCNNRRNYRSGYNYNGCDRCDNGYYNNGCDSRRVEPRTRITCANQRDNGFTPCCDDDCACKHHHDCGCDD